MVLLTAHLLNCQKIGVDIPVNSIIKVPFLVEGVITNMTPLIPTEWQRRLRADRLERLLNYEPNPFQDISSFKRNMLVDLILDGNIFIYFDGAGLYNLPADQITVVGDEETYIKEYRLSSGIRCQLFVAITYPRLPGERCGFRH